MAIPAVRRSDQGRADHLEGGVSLDSGIVANCDRNSEIFPLLREISLISERPDWMKGLTFPERLLNKTLKWKEYGELPMRRTHPLFGRVNEYIGDLRRAARDRKLTAAAQAALGSLADRYEQYVNNVYQSRGKERVKYVKGPARLIGFLHGEAVCKEIKQSKARALVSFNAFRYLTKSNAYGSSAVYRDGNRNVFYKRARCNPLDPGKEFAVGAFNHIFCGMGSPPSTFFKLEDVTFRDCWERPDRGHQLYKDLDAFFKEKGKNGAPLVESFIKEHQGVQTYPFIEKRENFFVQASLGVEGTELHLFLRDHSLDELKKRVKPYNFSAMVLLALALRPDDGRADNYMLTPSGEIVGIDNDGALGAPIQKLRSGNHLVALKTVLLLLPMMKDRLNQEFVTYFTGLSLEKVFVDWLYELKSYNKEVIEHFTDRGVLLERDLRSLSLPIRVSSSNLLSMYRTMKRFQNSLKENANQTHNDLFKMEFPVIYEVYQKRLEKEEPLLDIQQATFYGHETIEDLVGRSKWKVEQEVKSFSGMEPSTSQLSTGEVLVKYLESILPKLEEEEQKKLINHAFRRFPEIKTLTLAHAKFSDEFFISLLRLQKLESVTIRDAKAMTHAGVLAALSRCPGTKIIIGKNDRFDAESLSLLIQGAREMKRSVFYQIGVRVYDLCGEDLSKMMEPALLEGHIPLANALKPLGINLQQVDRNGATLLHRLAESGLVAGIEFLMKNCGFPIHVTDRNKETPFHYAARGGRLPNMEALLQIEVEQEKSGGLELKNSKGETPFNIATKNKEHEIGKFLLKEITKEERIENHLAPDTLGYTLLHFAAKYGVSELISPLIKKGYHVDVRGDYDYHRTPLHMASFNSQMEAARLLIEEGADVNVQTSPKDNSKTPLHDAVIHGDERMVHVLLEAPKINLSVLDIDGHAPIWHVVRDDLLEIAGPIFNHKSYKSFAEGPNSIPELIKFAKERKSMRILPMLETRQIIDMMGAMGAMGAMKATSSEHGQMLQCLQTQFNMLLNPPPAAAGARKEDATPKEN